MNVTDPPAKPDPSFSSIYREHYPMVFRFGYRLLGDAEQATDLSQEVFLKLYAALDRRAGDPRGQELAFPDGR